MIELDSLKFTVDTAELVNAVTKVQDLQKAVTQLNKPLVENAKISAKVAAENAKVAVAEEKVAQAKAKTAEAENKANAAKARAEKATDSLIKKTKEQTSVLERQQAIYEFMTAGYSKGQATVLAQAKAQGALADEIAKVGKVLADQRKLIGGDPFDKSVSGLTSLRNAMVELRDEQRTFTAGVQMTSKQYKEFARDKLRIIEVSKAEGATLSELKQRLRDHGAEYVRLTNEVNRLTEAEKARERAQRDQLNASRSIAAEDEKIASILRSVNSAQTDHISLSDRAARSIANYERNLRIAGISGEQAAIKLEKYRQGVLAVQKAEQKRQVDMLSRALAPQISDVAVSLASGMNPLTVALQQGLQIRDLIGLSGVAVQDLQVAFKSAASDMVSSLKGTAAALGSLFLGAITDAGKGVLNFGSRVTGTNIVLEKMRGYIVSIAGDLPIAIKAFDALAKVIAFTTGLSILALIASLIAAGVALRDVIREEDNLAKTLALSNGQLAISHSTALEYAKAMNSAGVSTSSTVEVIAQMAKAGNLTSDSIQMITKAAVDLKTYGGVAIEDTVKSFSKMRDEPVKAMIELAKTTGMVPPAVLNAVNSLVQQGKTAEATALAMKTLAEVNSEQVKRMKEDYSDFGMFLINLSKGIRDFFNDIFKDLFYQASPDQLATKQLEALTTRIEEVRSNLKFNSLGGLLQTDNSLLKSLEAQAATLRRQIESRAIARSLASQQKEEQNKINSSLARTIGLEETLKTNAAKRTEEIAKANKDYDLLIAKGLRTEQDRAKAIAAINEKYKDAGKPKTDAEKELEKIRKGQVRDIERLNDLLEENKQKRENLTEAERIYIDIMSSEDWAKKTPLQKQEIENLVEKAKAEELAARALKQRLEIENQIYAAKAAAQDLNFKEIEAARATVVDLINQNEATREQIGLIGAEAGATEELAKIKLKKLIASKEEYLMAKRNAAAGEDILYLLEREIELLKEQLGLIDAKTGKQSFVEMRNSVADAIVTGLFEGGKAGSQKLRDIIEAELRKPITVFIRAVVGDIFGGGSSTGSSTGGIGESGSATSKLFSNFNTATPTGQTVFNSISSFVGKFGASAVTDMLTTFASGMMSTGSMAAATEAFKAGGAQMAGAIAGSVLNGFSGYGISKALSGGYSAGGSVNTIAALASMIPGVGPIAGVIGGLVNRAFGRKLKDTGIQGTFSGTDQFTGNTFQFYKGGWFRSDKTTLGELDPMLASGLGQAYGGLTSANMAMANYLGINASDRLSGFRSDVKFSTQGLNEQQIQQKLQEVLGNVAEEQAKLLLGTYETVTKKGFLGFLGKTEQVWKPSEFIRFGETASEALTRLSTSLKSVNTFLSNTNTTMLAFSVAGADMASSLVDLFGGVQNFDQITGQYYQNFFTEQERLTKGQELLANAFKDLGMEVPATVTAYRQLIESQDLTTESGRQTFAALMNLSAAFYELDTASREATATMIEEINRLRGVVQTTSTGGFEGTRASFLSAIAAAGAGDATAMASLPGLSQSLESMFAGNARSLEDVNRFRSWLANSIGSVVPAFADGGIHAGGIRLVGENGPELEVTGPSRIFSAGETAGMLGGNNVVQAIAVLNQNLELLRAEVRADVQHNAKTAKLLDIVIPEGDSVNISGTIDGGVV